MENTLAEHIGYFNAFMSEFDDDEIISLLHFMKQHKVHMKKSTPLDDPDRWWFFLLPQGSTKIRQEEYQGEVPRYTVRLPDGFSFTLEQGPLNRDGYFTSPPLVFISMPEEKKQDG